MKYEEVFFNAPTDFWAIEKWSFSEKQKDTMFEGDIQPTINTKEGKVTFYTYTRAMTPDKLIRVHKERGFSTYSLFEYNNKWGVIKDFEIKAVGFDSLTVTAYRSEASLIPVQKKEKWGYLNENGETFITPQYNQVTPFEKTLTAVQKGQKWGLIGKNNKPATAFEYDTIMRTNYEDYQYEVKKNGLMGILDAQGKIVLPIEYKSITSIGQKHFIGTDKAGKQGISNYQNKVIMPYQYDEIKPYKENTFKVKKDNKIGIATLENKLIVSIKYDEIKDSKCKDNFFYIVLNGKNGIADATGKEVVAPEYDQTECYDYFTVVTKNGKTGVLDSSYAVFVPIEYEEIERFADNKESVVAFKQNGKWGFFNQQGKVVASPMYDEAPNTYSAPYIAKKGGKYGLVDALNRTLLNFEYDNIQHIYTDKGYFMKVTKNQKEAIHQASGEVLIPLVYDELGHFRIPEGLFLGVKKKGKWGYINEKQKMIIPAIYEDAQTFEKVLGNKIFAIVKKGGKWGMIDAKNKVILPFVYDELYWNSFQKGELYAIKGEKTMYINMKGEEIESK